MPGILPMKVIKMGSSAHLRIAQACDRCRSKKIRCDGVRPCCSQCANVGFECKTSDKLSRRAFPRGYTESLEERVRSLETEVRELKELLDEKDEKIDMLARINPKRSLPPAQSRATPPRHDGQMAASTISPSAEDATEEDVIFTIQQAPFLNEQGQPESFFVGTSSGISFLDSFKHRIQEKGKIAIDIKPSNLLKTASRQTTKATATVLSPLQSRPPSRLATDQYVNIFFQEWAPLFPILHRPAFLSLYERFLSAPEAITDKKGIAQLYLVFGLAALSQGNSARAEISSIELQWQTALQQVQTDQCLDTLQCLLLAQLFCMQKGDCSQLLTYKALAISLSSRLGLPQSQKRFGLGALTCETRKRTFWTLYTIDTFSAVQLGLPRQIKDEDVFCEMPVDADDEYITEHGFQPALPGESTRLSSALALFRAARILAKVLNVAYPALPSYELSSRQIAGLAQELEDWQTALAPHLRLTFAQDKPSAATISSRTPLLSLTYHYIRFLIHRPIVCASSSSAESSSSALAMASSCKHIAQIVNLLSERGLSFSFCMNKAELLTLCGLGLLMQGLDLEDGSKVLKDNHKMVALIISQLDRMKAPEGSEFRRLACSFLPLSAYRAPPDAPKQPVARHASEGSMMMPSSSTIPASMKQQFKAMTTKFSNLDAGRPDSSIRRQSHIGVYGQTVPSPLQHTSGSSENLRVSQSEPSRSPNEPYTSLNTPTAGPKTAPASVDGQPHQASLHPHFNLDYLSFSSGTSTPGFEHQAKMHKAQQSDWERLLATIDNGHTNIFDNIYGGPPVDLLNEQHISAKQPHRRSTGQPLDEGLAWNPSIWAVDAADSFAAHAGSGTSESAFSMSDAGSRNGSLAMTSLEGSISADEQDLYKGILMPDIAASDDGIWDTPEQGYALV